MQERRSRRGPVVGDHTQTGAGEEGGRGVARGLAGWEGTAGEEEAWKTFWGDMGGGRPSLAVGSTGYSFSPGYDDSEPCNSKWCTPLMQYAKG